MRGSTALVFGWAVATTCAAVTPLTPRLASASRAELHGQLASAGVPEVARPSVVQAITAVLGVSPEARSYRYDEPYPQLPKVQAQATPVSAGCADVVARVWFEPPAAALRASVAGRYCLSGAAVWAAESQRVTAGGS